MASFRVYDFSSKLLEMIQAPTSSQAAAIYMRKYQSGLVCVHDETGKFTIFDSEATGVVDDAKQQSKSTERDEESEEDVF